MKTRLILIGLLVAACCLQSAASTRSRPSALEIVQINEAPYPASMLQRGITSGEVDVIVNVDLDGRVIDWLVAAYTHAELLAGTEEMLRSAVFKPVKIDGAAQPVRGRLTFGFEARGVVVSQTILDHVDARMRDMLGGRRIERIATIRQLDQQLTATRRVTPGSPREESGRKLAGSVTLDFLIDENGRVRMPVLDSADHRVLAEAAVAALMEWQFDPPTHRGQPVIVKAKQQFLFKPENT